MNVTAPSTYPDARENLLLLLIGVGEHLSDVTKRAVSCRTENSGGGEGGLGGWAYRVEEEESARRDFTARGARADHMSKRCMDDAAGHVT